MGEVSPGSGQRSCTVCRDLSTETCRVGGARLAGAVLGGAGLALGPRLPRSGAVFRVPSRVVAPIERPRRTAHDWRA
jgi:hypothetical protein